MSVEIRSPTERTCERCGRVEIVDDDTGSWGVEEPGRIFCVHEWDINGAFVPVDRGDEGE